MNKSKFRTSNKVRAIAGIILGAFFLNISLGYAELGAPGSMGAPEMRVSSRVGDIVIPEDLGFIRERYTSPNSNSPLVVHIQDAHASADAQHNIRSIIEFLNHQYGFSLVLLEGGSGELDPSLLQIFKDPKYNAEMIEYLMHEGEVNGSTAAVVDSAYSNAQLIPYGLESREAYEKDLKQFKKVWNNLEIGHRFTQKLSQSINRAASKYANKDLRAFLKEWQWFKESKSHLNSYLNYLRKTAKTVLNLELADPREQKNWPVLVRIFRLKEFEPKLNFKDAEKEWRTARAFLETAKIEKIILDEIDIRLHKQKHGELAELSTRDLFEGLLDEAPPKGFSFKDYPALSTWVGSVILKDEVGSEEIFQEIEKLNDKIFSALAQEKDEEQIVELHKQVFLLNDLFHLELNRNDFLKLRTGKNIFSPEAMVSRVESIDLIAELLSKHEINQAQKLYGECLKSYEFAFLREAAFFDNLKKAFQLSHEGKAITVTGGFHTDGFAEKLKESNMSYLIVSPKISSFDNAKEEEHNYVKSLLQVSPKNLSASLRTSPVFISAKQERVGNPNFPADEVLRAVLKVAGDRKLPVPTLLDLLNIPGMKKVGIEVATNRSELRFLLNSKETIVPIRDGELLDLRGARQRNTIANGNIVTEQGQIPPGMRKQFETGISPKTPIKTSQNVEQMLKPNDFNLALQRSEARLLSVGDLLGSVFGIRRQKPIQNPILRSSGTPGLVATPLAVTQGPQIVRSRANQYLIRRVTGIKHSEPAMFEIGAVSGFLAVNVVRVNDDVFKRFLAQNGVSFGQPANLEGMPQLYRAISNLEILRGSNPNMNSAVEARVLSEIPTDLKAMEYDIYIATVFHSQQFKLDIYLPHGTSREVIDAFRKQIAAEFKKDAKTLGLSENIPMSISVRIGNSPQSVKGGRMVIITDSDKHISLGENKYWIHNNLNQKDLAALLALSEEAIKLAVVGLDRQIEEQFRTGMMNATEFVQVTGALQIVGEALKRLASAA